jgi:hypothetical protein
MGNAETKLTNDTTPMLRYTTYGWSETHRNQTIEYVYISSAYNLEIHPGDRRCPIHSYDPSYWSKFTEKPQRIYVKRELLEEAAEFLKTKDEIENKIQIHLAVSDKS